MKHYHSKHILFAASVFLMASIALITFAVSELTTVSIENDVLSAFRKYKSIEEISIKVPTVVEVPIENDFLERYDFAVLNETESKLEPSYFIKDEILQKIPVTASSLPSLQTTSLMVDNNTNTYTEFLLPEDANGTVQINLSSSRPITSSALTLLLDNNVALPTSIEIRAEVGGINNIVVAKSALERQSVKFPKTTSMSWSITFTYSQPLRISELRLEEENTAKTISRGLRFLAKPNSTYIVYFDSDRQVDPRVGEAGNLVGNEGVLKLDLIPTISNPMYMPADSDNDGIPDTRDNCVIEPNVDQEDIDKNGRGDACDDYDKDGIINSKDNCVNDPNRNQADEDGDGIGDACDSEESRLTEKLPWIPWVGIGFAAIVLVTLFVLTARSNQQTVI